MVRIGVDLGGTKTEAIALGENGEELQRVRVPTVQGEYHATLSTITALVQQVEGDLAVTASVGVGIPGTIVAETGLVKNANSTWLNGHPLARDLSDSLSREVRCANDANCFAVSEAADGAGVGAGVVFGAILGTGCGGGLVLHNAPHAGPNGLAGEWGHLPLPWPTEQEIPGPPCYCGRSGCLETWISGRGFERDYLAHSGVVRQGRDIVDLMRRGDVEAVQAFLRLRNRLARGCAVLVDILDPDVIVLGGGLSNIAELYDGVLESEIAHFTFGGNSKTAIRRNRHGDSSGVRGAAWLWPASVGNNPTGPS